MAWLINAAQLEKFRKSQKSLIILDASWYLPKSGHDGRQEFLDKHIAGSSFFDITAFDDLSHEVPHMIIRDEKIISEKLSAMGLRNDYKIIFYDNSDLHTSCRAVWLLKLFGHNPNQLYILDGGLKAWEKSGGSTESHSVTVSPKQYTANFQPEFMRTLEQMKMNLKNPTEQVVDLRHPVRFAGGKEPRSGLRVGHIPGSACFPYFSFFNTDGYFLPLDVIRKRLTDVCVDINYPIVATCGSGTTAAILDFVLDLMGHQQHALYDGSWSEWGALQLFPGETSLDERPVESCVDN